MGISFVYAATGTLYLTQVAERIQNVDGQLPTLTQTGVVLTLIGFAFKTAAVPFHFWVPDTYVGAPLPIAAYLSVVGKAVGSPPILITVVALPSYADVWGPALAALAALTMTVGNVGALRQQATRAYSAVRLLAWSSVGQAGYLLVPIAAAAYSDDAEHSIGSTVAYALMYAAVNLGAFAVAALWAARRPSTASPTTAACTRPTPSPPSCWPSSCSASPDCRPVSSASSPRSPSSPQPSTPASAGSPSSWPSTS
ncbi:NAD(P)H-quinone oxidoreductase subunit 2, chloroplastic [Streptomyces alboniger]